MSQLANGTTIAYGDTPTLIANLLEINPAPSSIGEYDDTVFGDTGEVFQSDGVLKAGDYKFKLDWDKVIDAALHGLIGTKQKLTINFADGSKTERQGFIKDVGVATPHKNKMTIDVTAKVDGARTFTPEA